VIYQAHIDAALAIPGWYSEARLRMLYSLADSSNEIAILEIGTWYGRSARVLAPHSRLTCIDTWEGIPGKKDSRYKDSGVLEEAKKNLAGFDVEFRQGDSITEANYFPNESFDLVHIDGDHTAPTVNLDVYNGWRLLRRGGILCGDDFDEGDVFQAVIGILPAGSLLNVFDRKLWWTRKIPS